MTTAVTLGSQQAAHKCPIEAFWAQCAAPMQSASDINFSLDAILAVAQNFIPLSFDCPVVTIAGTNGKGSTLAVLDALAQHAGMRVATYTSPHLYAFNERIKINGLPIETDKALECLQAVQYAQGEGALSYFEHTTLAALYYFHQEKPDLIILEVGMGGRLDATNIVESDIAIITSIGLDHTQFLGDTKEAIASEKAGIMRFDKPVICGDLPMQDFLRFQADMVAAKFYGLGKDFQLLAGLKSTLIPSNIACAVKAAELLNLPVSDSVIESVTVPGRRQHLTVQGKNVLLDVAHNEDSLRALLQYIQDLAPARIHLVMGIMCDKVMGQALNDLAAHCATIHLSAAKTPRAMPADKLMDIIDAPSQIYSSVDIAFTCALSHCQPNDLVVVTGSFMTLAELPVVL